MFIILRHFRDHDFRREQQARNRRRVLDDLTQRLFDRARQDANADRLVFAFCARISATPPGSLATRFCSFSLS